jgi:hypothetical protein
MLNSFNLDIEKRALSLGSYREAVLGYAEEKDMEVEDVVDLLNTIIKKKIEHEFINANLFPSKKNITKLENFFKD